MNRRLAPELYLAVVPIGGSRGSAARRPQAGVRIRRQDARVPDRRAPRPAARGEPRAARRARRVRRPARDISRRPAARSRHRRRRDRRDGAAQRRRARGVTSDRGSRSKLATLRAWTQLRGARLAAAVRAARGSRRPPRMPRRPASAESAVARRRDHGVRRARVRPQAARDRRHQRGRVPRDGLARARPRRSRLRVPEPLSRGRRRLRRRRRAALLSRPPRVGPRQGRRDQARAGGVGRARRATATSPRRSSSRRARDRCSSSRTACPAAARLPSPTSWWAACPALRARSDLERKRLHGLEASARTGSSVGGGPLRGRRDAAYLRRVGRRSRTGCCATAKTRSSTRRSCAASERLEFRQVAAVNAARFAILDCTASAAELRRRVARARRARAATRRRPISPCSSTSCARRNLSIARNGASRVTVDTE